MNKPRIADVDVADVLEAAGPDLQRWFTRNHGRISAFLSETKRPGWQTIADSLSEAGFRKPDGAAITAAYARQAWWKVNRKLKKAHPALTSPPKPVSPPPPPAPWRPSSDTTFDFVKLKE